MERGLHQTLWAARPTVTRPGCPLGEQREMSYPQTSSAPAAMAPEADKGLAHVTWAGAQGRNCSRAQMVPSVQFRELTPNPAPSETA